MNDRQLLIGCTASALLGMGYVLYSTAAYNRRDIAFQKQSSYYRRFRELDRELNTGFEGHKLTDLQRAALERYVTDPNFASVWNQRFQEYRSLKEHSDVQNAARETSLQKSLVHICLGAFAGLAGMFYFIKKGSISKRSMKK